MARYGRKNGTGGEKIPARTGSTPPSPSFCYCHHHQDSHRVPEEKSQRRFHLDWIEIYLSIVSTTNRCHALVISLDTLLISRTFWLRLFFHFEKDFDSFDHIIQQPPLQHCYDVTIHPQQHSFLCQSGQQWQQQHSLCITCPTGRTSSSCCHTSSSSSSSSSQHSSSSSWGWSLGY
jgi:hypothetical protein